MNGGIDLENVSGSGTVNTLNGKMKVVFSSNPRKECTFHTLNGAVDVYFQKPLNADLKYSTLNGGVWADFDVDPVAPAATHNGDKLIYSFRGNRNRSGRVGSGGPLLTFNGLNGAIRLHANSK